VFNIFIGEEEKMDGQGLSASDIALLNKDGGSLGWGESSFMWIFALLILANGGFGGWGSGNAFANAIGYENLATSSEVQRGFDNQNSMANQREILAAVNNGTAQSVAATNQSSMTVLLLCRACTMKQLETLRPLRLAKLISALPKMLVAAAPKWLLWKTLLLLMLVLLKTVMMLHSILLRLTQIQQPKCRKFLTQFRATALMNSRTKLTSLSL
jgi:hypothetical protein